jgi:hypothetical protein
MKKYFYLSFLLSILSLSAHAVQDDHASESRDRSAERLTRSEDSQDLKALFKERFQRDPNITLEGLLGQGMVLLQRDKTQRPSSYRTSTTSDRSEVRIRNLDESLEFGTICRSDDMAPLKELVPTLDLSNRLHIEHPEEFIANPEAAARLRIVNSARDEALGAWFRSNPFSSPYTETSDGERVLVPSAQEVVDVAMSRLDPALIQEYKNHEELAKKAIALRDSLLDSCTYVAITSSQSFSVDMSADPNDSLADIKSRDFKHLRMEDADGNDSAGHQSEHILEQKELADHLRQSFKDLMNGYDANRREVETRLNAAIDELSSNSQSRLHNLSDLEKKALKNMAVEIGLRPDDPSAMIASRAILGDAETSIAKVNQAALELLRHMAASRRL